MRFMFDNEFIEYNLEAVKKNITDLFLKADADLAATLYDRHNKVIKQLDDGRQKRH